MVFGPITGFSDPGCEEVSLRVCLGWLAGLYHPLSKQGYKEEDRIWRGQRQPCVLLS